MFRLIFSVVVLVLLIVFSAEITGCRRAAKVERYHIPFDKNASTLLELLTKLEQNEAKNRWDHEPIKDTAQPKMKKRCESALFVDDIYECLYGADGLNTRPESTTVSTQESTTTLKQFSCSEYTDVYKKHFFDFSYEIMTYNSGFDVSRFLYEYTPICTFVKPFENEKFDSSNSARVIEGIGKPFNPLLDVYANFDFYLNEYIKFFLEGETLELGFSKFFERTTEHDVAKIYVTYLNRFFERPMGTSDIDKVVFDIIVPFRNKLHCILFDNKKKKHCRECLQVTDKFECCSLTFYSDEKKREGEAHIKKKAREIYEELAIVLEERYDSYFRNHSRINCLYSEKIQETCDRHCTKNNERYDDD